ncbi:MAG: hypothetical protein ACK4GM_04050 [Tabrizicola sp.]
MPIRRRIACFAGVGVIAALPAAGLAHETPLPEPRPMDQMQGPCSDFAMDIEREAAAWASPAVASVTAATARSEAPEIVPGAVVPVALHPHPEVEFDVAPEKDRGTPDKFSGHVRVTLPEAGLWRVAASNGLWFDAVVGGAIVPSAAFEMQTQCSAPFKVVVFDLPAGPVDLQFNGSPAPEVQVMVLPWAPR